LKELVNAEGNPAPNRVVFGAGITPADLTLGLGSLLVRVRGGGGGGLEFTTTSIPPAQVVSSDSPAPPLGSPPSHSPSCS
jgi:hypothetical protein